LRPALSFSALKRYAVVARQQQRAPAGGEDKR
jgi:hypothetical protein